MQPFIHENFLLHDPLAQRLYHEHAAREPIIDYHNHLSPADIAADRHWPNLGKLWLEGDHYKWRAMRANGVPEEFITGAAPDRDKFRRWAETVPATVGNPLYVWTHMELNRPFGIADALDADTADSVWARTQALLETPPFSARGLLRSWQVKELCTTDDPADSLEHHAALASEKAPAFRTRPTFRPDRAFAVDRPSALNEWLAALEKRTDRTIRTFADLLAALEQRANAFDSLGCALSDHGLEYIPIPLNNTADPSKTFAAARDGHAASPEETACYRFALLVELGRLYHRLGWVQQYHLGALRDVNTRGARQLGMDGGYDCIGAFPQARGLARLLDTLDRDDRLPRTILYNLNPADSEVFAAIAGSFQDGSTPGKIQYGSAWWFLDQQDGIEAQLRTLANTGLLSRFVGMVTDSRSFLSFSRHEYFRRILCGWLARGVAQGRLPNDEKLFGGLVRDISYRNAAAYFDF